MYNVVSIRTYETVLINKIGSHLEFNSLNSHNSHSENGIKHYLYLI